jgi:hypothetical protein
MSTQADPPAQRSNFMRKYNTLKVLAVALFSAAMLFSPPLAAQPDDAYARFFGDGLRHLGEGRLSEAVEELFRAYAIDESPQTLSLIIGAYDRMGFCDAADVQRQLHADRHPESEPPRSQRCANTGQLRVECDRPAAPVRVDGRFEVACGQTVTLPAGEHHLVAASAAPVVVHVEADQTAQATVASPAPEQSSASPQVRKVAESSANVERLLGELAYTVYMSQDGLYQLVIHPHGFSGGPVPLRPEVLRLCDTGEFFDRDSRRCMPSDSMKIHKME